MIRPYAPSDAAGLRALAAELAHGVAAWRPHDGVLAAAAGWVESDIATAGDPARCLLVAVDDDGVCGFAGAAERTHFSGQREAYLGELVVAPRARRRGLGGELLAAVEVWAAGRGLERLTLETGWANEGARAFYESAGFAVEQVMFSRAVK